MKKAKTNMLDFNEIDIDKMSIYISETHHSCIKNAILEFAVRLKTILKVDEKEHPEVKLINNLYEELKEILEQHIIKEEHFLFPHIAKLVEMRNLNIPNKLSISESTIKKIKNEHRKVEKTLKKIRQLSNDYTPTVKSSPALKLFYAQLFNFEQDIHKHIFLEENFLFPRVIELEKEL